MTETVPVSDGAKQRRATTVCLIIFQLLYLLLIPLWLGFAVITYVFAVDTDVYSPSNQAARFLAWSLFAPLAAYPIIFMISAILAWILYARRKHRLAFSVNSIPLAELTLWSGFFIPLSILAHPASAISIGIWPWAMIPFFLLVWVAWIPMAKAIGLFISLRSSATGN